MLNKQPAAATINNNTPVQARDAFTPQQQTEIAAMVQAEVKNCLYYGVQCVSTEKAAELLSVEPGTVRDWIATGKLPASKPGNTYLILLWLYELINAIKNVKQYEQSNSHCRPYNNTVQKKRMYG